MKPVINKLTISLLILGVICCFSSCQKNPTQNTELTAGTFKVTVNFQGVVDGASLKLEKQYKTPLQESYSVKTFKYYISALELVNSATGKVYAIGKNNYYLVDAANPSSGSILLAAGAGKYDRISFIVGVDSTRGMSAARKPAPWTLPMACSGPGIAGTSWQNLKAVLHYPQKLITGLNIISAVLKNLTAC